MSKQSLIIPATLLLFAFLAIPVAAQEQNTCVALVLSAISQTSTRCATNGIDSACYGNDNVHGTFAEESSPGVFTRVPEADQNFFVKPGDQADLRLTEAIQTGPLDQVSRPPSWGISVMNVQAGLPNETIDSLDGRGVIYFMLGGVEVESDVEPQDALDLLPAGVAVSIVAAADMRAAPVAHDTATGSNVMARVPANTTLNADAITPDGMWVRVIFEDRPGWISRATVDPQADLSSLVVIGPEDFTPMQSFFFRDGIRHDVRGPGCALAPSFLFVQGPEDIPVHLRVHRVDLRLESSMILRTVPPGDDLGNFFEIIPLSGMVTVFPDTDNEIFVPPGYVLRLRLGKFVSLGTEDDVDEKVFTGVAGPIRPLTNPELDELRIVETLPDNLLHYVPEVPSVERPSGVGDVIARIIYKNPRALRIVRDRCQGGQMPPQVCRTLGF